MKCDILLQLLLVVVLIFAVNGRGGRGGGGRSGGRGGYSWRRSSGSRSSSYSRGYSSSSRSTSYNLARKSFYADRSSSTRWQAPRLGSYSALNQIISRIRFTIKKTKYGTKFSEEAKWNMKRRMSRKLFGLGVGPAFIGGAGFGFGAGLASYSIYHRYNYFRYLMHKKGYIDDWDSDYDKEYYDKKRCLDGCPRGSHCEWGICECNENLKKAWGNCHSIEPGSAWGRNMTGLNKNCTVTTECQTFDMNAVCTLGVCACRRDMGWNPMALECQIFLNVDCTRFDYSSPVSSLVSEAVRESKPTPKPVYRPNHALKLSQCWSMTNKRQMDLCNIEMLSALTADDPWERQRTTTAKPLELEMKSIPTSRTETQAEALSSSIFRFIKKRDPDITKNSLEEAFCRDIDAFNEAFAIDDAGRPTNCPEIPSYNCAVLYDSSTCSGGWVLQVKPGAQKKFLYFSNDWKYRNDVDTIGVRRGCTFTGFTGSSFNGERMILTAGNSDRWVVLSKEEQFQKFDEDIESLQCVCRL